MKKLTIAISIFAAATALALVLHQITKALPKAATTFHKDLLTDPPEHAPFLKQVSGDQKWQEPRNPTLADVEALKIIRNGLDSLKKDGGATSAKLARSGNAAMESFVKNWNPIGRTPYELKALFGNPKEESSDFLLYAFDNGSYAWLYRFVIRDGKVVQLTRPLSE